jgi:ankyrin repeat protein
MFKIVDDSDLTQLEELLLSSRTHDGNVRQSAGLAPLVLAVACNKPDAVRLLLQLGADVNRPVDNVVWLPVGDEDNIRGRYILKSGSPLLSANSTEVLELLLKATSEIIKINIDDWSKLWQLTITRGSPAMLCSLLASKCQPIGYRGDVNIALQQLLTEAVEYRSEVAVKHLLDLGANPNSTLADTFKLNHRVQQQGLLNPNNLKCPLQIAMSLNNVPMCTKLLDQGAILSSVVLLEGNMETQQNLLESVTDAAVRVKPDEWGKLCRMAIEQNAEKLFSLLVTKCQWHDDKKPLPIPVKNELQKLLLAAVDCDSDAFVGHLLDLGADPNRPGTLPNIYVQKSPLYVAISKNNVSRCNLLFSRGAVLKSSVLLAGNVHIQPVLLQNVTGVLDVTLDDWAKLLRGAIEEDAQTLFLLLATKFQLEQASNTNVKNDLQRLLFEAIERDCEAAINCLLDFGADPNGEVVFGDWKQGPLFVAAERKRLSLCHLLISRGALLNCSEQYKDAMIQAVLYDSVIAAETLLCVGSTCRCNDQLALNMWGEVGELVNGSSRGSLPCPHQGANGTLLHYAIVFGNLSIVRFMVEACHANLEAKIHLAIPHYFLPQVDFCLIL